jgi:pimeloyl-ACP methyl ester carboxylesterase
VPQQVIDPGRGRSSAEALHAAIPTSQLVVLSKLGHAFVVEDPEACAVEIRRFVKTRELNPSL